MVPSHDPHVVPDFHDNAHTYTETETMQAARWSLRWEHVASHWQRQPEPAEKQ